MENIDIKYFDIENLGIWPIHKNELQVNEGNQKLSLHLMRERNSQIVKLAKKLFKQKNEGKVFCEICKFDFMAKYGDIGESYIEAHHKKPISKMKAEDVTRIDDFIMVCSNCHSMLHIGKEGISYEDLILRIKDNER